MRSAALLVAIVAPALVLSAPSAAIEPCAQVSATLASNGRTDFEGNLIINADVAYACLQSVPLDVNGATAQLEGLKTSLKFQSDLSYLSNPPPGWLYTGVDVMGSLDAISEKLQAGGYDGEYSLQLDLHDLVISAHDFHFMYTADILDVLGWKRGTQLVSVSTDGTSLPNVYVAADARALAGLDATHYKPSAIVKINDTNVETWLNKYATVEPWDHDPDASYNQVFVNIPSLSTMKFGSTFTTYFYHFPGAQTRLTFDNGTSMDVLSYATANLDFAGVVDGETFFSKFCSGPQASSSASASVLPSSTPFASLSIPATSSGSATASASGSGVAASSVTTNNLYTPLASASASPLPRALYYPQPAVQAPDYSFGGYFPGGQKDLAVATVPTFQPSSNYMFQNKLRTFLATAKSLGKTKLILDLRGNGGGDVVDGYGFFTELFPSQAPYGLGNLAAFPLVDAVGQVVSGYSDRQIAQDKVTNILTFDFEENLDAKNGDYNSWSDFYGPIERHGGSFTNARRYNFSSPLGLPDPIYGYINDTRPQPQTFEPSNIVILTDGFCGSTCALFSELVKTQAPGVQFIAVGGRKQTGPMQAVGGSKGSNDQELSIVANVTLTAYQRGDEKERALFAPYVQGGLEEAATQALQRAPSASVNWINNLRKADDTFTPLQFVYEAANCRFFYTAQMLFDQSLVWQQTYNLGWNAGNATCVPGSSGHPSAKFGFDTSYINAEPPASAKNFFGADISWTYPGALKMNASSSQISTPSSSAPASGSSGTTAPTPASGNAASSLYTAMPVVVCLAAAFAGFLLV